MTEHLLFQILWIDCIFPNFFFCLSIFFLLFLHSFGFFFEQIHCSKSLQQIEARLYQKISKHSRFTTWQFSMSAITFFQTISLYTLICVFSLTVKPIKTAPIHIYAEWQTKLQKKSLATVNLDNSKDFSWEFSFFAQIQVKWHRNANQILWQTRMCAKMSQNVHYILKC